MARKSPKRRRRFTPEISPTQRKKRSHKGRLLPEEFLFTGREVAFTVFTVLALTASFGATIFLSLKLGLTGLVCGLAVAALGFSDLYRDLNLPRWVIAFEAVIAATMLSLLWRERETGALVALGFVLLSCGLFVAFVIYYRKEERRERFLERLERWEDRYYAKRRKELERKRRREKASD